ncbi:MAG: SurA N-terminal domain-containing protein [Anaerolineae bacterium]|nr:SurA N-terminal domain-containing protein [Anaerolineae bacterium]
MEKSTRWGIITLIVGLGVVAALMAMAMAGQEVAQGTAAATPTTAQVIDDPPVAQVNGQSISVNTWAELVRVEQAISSLARVTAPSAEEVLEWMIDGELLLQEAPQDVPGEAQVAAAIADLQAAWGVDEAQVSAALEAANLEWETLADAVSRRLMVAQAQEDVAAAGTPVDQWLAGQRAGAEIVYHAQRMQIVLYALGPTPTPVPQYPVAPDFTLRFASEDRQFSLYDQLAKGPVVLVFFQKCG